VHTIDSRPATSYGEATLLHINNTLSGMIVLVSHHIHREYCRGVHYADHATPSPQTLAPTSPTSVCRSVGIVRSRTKDTEFHHTLASHSTLTIKHVYQNNRSCHYDIQAVRNKTVIRNNRTRYFIFVLITIATCFGPY
jgi:hypothetical protein